jgi:hypothetical protein
LPFYAVISKLSLYRSAYGAYISARTAINASVSVDFVCSVALRDSAYGTLVSTSTAHNALISDFISHSIVLLLLINIFYHISHKMQ